MIFNHCAMTSEDEDAYDFRLEHVLLPTGHELNKRQTSRDELFALFGHCAPYADRSLPLAQYHAQDTFLADRAREKYKENLSNAGVRVRYKRAPEDLWATVTVTWGDLAVERKVTQDGRSAARNAFLALVKQRARMGLHHVNEFPVGSRPDCERRLALIVSLRSRLSNCEDVLRTLVAMSEDDFKWYGH